MQRTLMAFPCVYCNKKFSENYLLDRHLVTHTRVRNHLCQVCGKSFLLSSALNRHVASHESQFAYGCDLCNKRFNRSSTRDVHRLSHEEKAHICNFCGKSFHQMSTLKMHKLVHTDVKPFSCSHCDKQFRQCSNLRVHVSRWHGNSSYSIDNKDSSMNVKQSNIMSPYHNKLEKDGEKQISLKCKHVPRKGHEHNSDGLTGLPILTFETDIMEKRDAVDSDEGLLSPGFVNEVGLIGTGQTLPKCLKDSHADHNKVPLQDLAPLLVEMSGNSVSKCFQTTGCNCSLCAFSELESDDGNDSKYEAESDNHFMNGITLQNQSSLYSLGIDEVNGFVPEDSRLLLRHENDTLNCFRGKEDSLVKMLKGEVQPAQASHTETNFPNTNSVTPESKKIIDFLEEQSGIVLSKLNSDRLSQTTTQGATSTESKSASVSTDQVTSHSEKCFRKFTDLKHHLPALMLSDSIHNNCVESIALSSRECPRTLCHSSCTAATVLPGPNKQSSSCNYILTNISGDPPPYLQSDSLPFIDDILANIYESCKQTNNIIRKPGIVSKANPGPEKPKKMGKNKKHSNTFSREKTIFKLQPHTAAPHDSKKLLYVKLFTPENPTREFVWNCGIKSR